MGTGLEVDPVKLMESIGVDNFDIDYNKKIVTVSPKDYVRITEIELSSSTAVKRFGWIWVKMPRD